MSKMKRLLILFLSLIGLIGMVLGVAVGAVAEEGYTTELHPDFTVNYGTWKQTDSEDVTQIKELVVTGVSNVADATKDGALVIGNFGGLVGENFNVSYDLTLPDSGQDAGFTFRSSYKENNIISVYETGGVYVRNDINCMYVIVNGAVKEQIAYSGTVAAGDVVTVELSVTGTSAHLKCMTGDTVLLEKDITGLPAYASGSMASFTATRCTPTFSNIVVTSGDETYNAYPFEKEPEEEKHYTDELHSDFTVNYGTWVQTDSDDVTQVKELVVTGVSNVADATKDGALVIGNFGGLVGENFNISYDLTLPDSGQDAGFTFRSSYKENNIISVYETGGVYVRNDINCMYVIVNGAVKEQIAYSGTVAAGDVVTVELSVTGTSAHLKCMTGDTVLLEKDITGLPAYASGSMASFTATRCTPTFSNIVVTSGDETYNAYPFEDKEISGGDETDDFGNAELKDKINPNFSRMCGTVGEAVDASRLEVTGLHITYQTASIVSDFGSAYGENFEMEFDVSVPTAQEYEINNDASSGFIFRTSDPTKVYSGAYVRVQVGTAWIVANEDKVATLTFSGTIEPASLVHVKVVVSGNDITVSFADKAGTPLKFTYQDSTQRESVTLTNFLPDYEEGQYAGLASDKAMGKFKNIVMTNSDTGKVFKAYPFEAGKEDLSANYKIVSTNPNDAIVPADTANPDFAQEDWDIVVDYDYIIYTDYNGQPHDVKVVDLEGNDVADTYIVTVNTKKPPYVAFSPWEPETNAGRHGIFVTISDAEGYVYANIQCALRIRAIEVTIEDVTAVNRAYDATREVQLQGGKLVGVMQGDDVGFDLGTGSLVSAKAENGKTVITYIQLTGEDSINYTLVQPTDVTVNITKAEQAAPDAPELEKVEGNTVTLKDNGESEYMEFKMDEGEWQTSLVFENVADGEHKFYARYVGDDNMNESTASEALTVTVGESRARRGCNSSIGTSALYATVVLIAVAVGMVVFKKSDKAE